MTTLNRYELLTIQIIISNRVEELRAHNANHPLTDATPDHEAVRQADAHYLADLLAIEAKLNAALEA